MKHIKKLNEQYYEEILGLSQFAFQYVLSENQLGRKKEQLNDQTIWGWIENDQLAAKVHVLTLRVHICGQIMKMGGIADVASWPEYRRGGKIKQLLKQALVEMRKEGHLLSYLHPFSVPFYRKYGWELAFDKVESVIPIQCFKKEWGGKGYAKRMSQSDQLLSVLRKVYTDYVTQFIGALERELDWWNYRIVTDDDVIAVVYNVNHEAEGYIIYKVKDNKLTVKDMAYSTVNGQMLLFEFLYGHDSMASEVVVSLPTGDASKLLVDEPRFEQKVKPYFMARIVDVPAFLHQFSYNRLDDISPFTISIEDDFLSENTGIYRFSNEDNGFVYSTEKNTLPNITISIQRLTQIFLGYSRPMELFNLDLIAGDRQAVEQLEKVVPIGRSYFPDFF
ncbi:GNAT family N-acetyltransferase [Gracilibacillus sp. S3-1-1]|uniref:GNAT family N-acetyltransferase n=1 Tax=Gracilibacillus pellucidus TaxID=3095368 RepID=A0ACC6M8Z5_9BACI|nr:GNAT family N-acetyltransferase [Gracilibacillus sp. S3-1-1]MDX8047405.1 GNAT family N-acetyltransferase [Gracilibacillus sp. S3-1-1]